ncbi:hypothetical protein YC2023_116810 [Brassica napus]
MLRKDGGSKLSDLGSQIGFLLEVRSSGAVTRFVRQGKWVWSVFRVARIGAEVFRSVSPLLIELIVAVRGRGPLQGMHRFQSSEGVRWYWPVRKLLHPLVTFSHGYHRVSFESLRL